MFGISPRDDFPVQLPRVFVAFSSSSFEKPDNIFGNCPAAIKEGFRIPQARVDSRVQRFILAVSQPVVPIVLVEAKFNKLLRLLLAIAFYPYHPAFLYPVCPEVGNNP